MVQSCCGHYVTAPDYLTLFVVVVIKHILWLVNQFYPMGDFFYWKLEVNAKNQQKIKKFNCVTMGHCKQP